MWDWWQRTRQRQRELAQGADADLVRANGKRWKIGLLLSGVSILLLAIPGTIHLSGIWYEIAGVVIFSVYAAGMILLWWARAESGFLSKPDPKKPPSILG
ncbi:MAG TPA: hypothetical protein VMH00_12280 [Candidatus Limnocylindrales bacterium]|nr:hypothetical protein [Candidatus Limnocylindrales bacterium]